VEGDYRQEGNGGQRKQEGFAGNIMHHMYCMYGVSLEQQIRT
jgi:prenyltransferase beta subunit